MKTVLDDAVKERVREYSRELKRYVSPERRRVKVQNMRQFLKNIGNLPTHRVCPNPSLGQVLDSQGNPTIKSLMRVNYSDESRFQWAIVYHIDEEIDTAFVIKMVPSSSVK